MNKNNDGTNRVIEKYFVFGLPVPRFGRESEMWISE